MTPDPPHDPPTTLQNFLGFFLVALAWGFTNPFIKRGSAGLELITQRHASSPWYLKRAAETWYLVTRWQYVLPLAINLSGSVLYYKTLGESDLSIAVPVSNMCTLALTLVAGALLGEDLGSRETIFGIGLIFTGVLLCTMSKL
ncbi:uncharacterized protein EV422DRAFT_89925 [Fimicolochytrium jonesii]|uniref:uncharacterized protein n=1 Tax=Fimicolochytrium jonesii TaxID=1396493 RepID=UPI0022FEDF45|nr:uncharacterized protein EV422DRAFT_89925 [Fimicolochytrium jonesii]KAI8819882.1 hypothetical protein EV422DRAFT_89925 [Fimicolochytrium jonesii]